MAQPLNVLVCGLGLIGGSLALAIKKNYPEAKVTGYDINSEVLKQAQAAQAVDEVIFNLENLNQNFNFVFIAVPIAQIPLLLEVLANHLSSETIITDVGSTKTRIVKKAAAVLPPSINFIGGHPLAGSEQQGFLAASADLFSGAVYVLTPTANTKPEVYSRLHRFLTGLGAKVMSLSPEKHDEIVAATSHLPHLVAFTLVNTVSVSNKDVFDIFAFAASGFKDVTRIAASNPQLWAEICLDNKEALKKQLQEFQNSLSKIIALLEANKQQELFNYLKAAQQFRLALGIVPGKANLKWLEIPVADKPGIVTELTYVFSRYGLNIEDIQLVHLGPKRGLIKLAVEQGKLYQEALTEVKKRGFEIREQLS